MKYRAEIDKIAHQASPDLQGKSLAPGQAPDYGKGYAFTIQEA